MCVWVHSAMWPYVEAKGWCPPQLFFYFIFWVRGLSLNLQQALLFGQKGPGVFLSLFPGTVVKDMCCHAWHGYRGSEVRYVHVCALSYMCISQLSENWRKWLCRFLVLSFCKVTVCLVCYPGDTGVLGLLELWSLWHWSSFPGFFCTSVWKLLPDNDLVPSLQDLMLPGVQGLELWSLLQNAGC